MVDEHPTFRQRIRGWWTLRKLKRIPAYRVALDEIRRLMNDENFNDWMTEKMKLKFANRMLEGLGAISQVPTAPQERKERLSGSYAPMLHTGC